MLAGAQYNALNTLHSTLCWLVQNYSALTGVRCACRRAWHGRTGGSSGAAVGQPRGAWTPRKLLDRLRASLRQKRPPSALLSPAFYDNFRFIIAAELYLAVSL